MFLAPQLLEALFREAQRCWPKEACGILLGPVGRPKRFLPLENIQDRLHSEDPASFPRDARTAYTMDALRLHRIVEEAEAKGDSLAAIFHSHPQYPSYFSRTDRQAAAPFGFPSFPGAAQLVLSIYDGEVRDLKAFFWEGEDWVERKLEGLPPLPGPPPGAAALGER